MSSLEITVPIRQVVPIQFEVSRPNLERLKSYRHLSPGEAVVYPYPKRLGIRYLLVEGHHRVFLEHEAGRKEAELIVAFEDQHLEQLRASTIRGCKTIEDVHDRYWARWRPTLRRAGVYYPEFNIADVVVLDEPRPSY